MANRYDRPHRVEGVYRRWMPYDAAKATVQSVGHLTSRSKYWKWHDQVGPYYIPKMPNRVYKEDWISWNDFLGVDNTWDGYDRAQMRESWLPFWEAVRTVQKLGLKTKPEYLQAYEDGLVPKTIPKAPDFAYEDWQGWPAFLGADLAARVKSAEHVVGILCLCSSSLLPSNVIEAIIAPEGKGQLKNKFADRSDLRVIKAYEWDADAWPQAKSVIETMGSDQGGGQFVVPNVNALLYEIDNILMIYRG